MLNGIVIAEEQTQNNNVILEITDERFSGIKFHYNAMKFADQENSDGTISLNFEYNIVAGEVPEGKEEEFYTFLGDKLIEILEKQLEDNEVIYKGGK